MKIDGEHGIKAAGFNSANGDKATISVVTTAGGKYHATCNGTPIPGQFKEDHFQLYAAYVTSPSIIEFRHRGDQANSPRKTHKKGGEYRFERCNTEQTDTRAYVRNQAFLVDWAVKGRNAGAKHPFIIGSDELWVHVILTLEGNVTLSNINSVKIPSIGEIPISEFSNNAVSRRIEVYRAHNNSPVASYDWLPGENAPLLQLQMGDSVVFKSNTRDLRLDGLADIWIARSAGESKYYCTPSIKMGGYRPFLGYDAKVHGVGLRQYEGLLAQNPRYPSMRQTPNNHNTYYTYWIAQRHMNADVSAYNAQAHGNAAFDKVKHASNFNQANFPIGGGQTVTEQRNNQREGYNMEILDRFFQAMGTNKIHNHIDDYRYPNLTGNFIAGLDGDELLYINHPYGEFTTLNDGEAVARQGVESWKKLRDWESADDDPIAWMVQTYQSNRLAQLDDDEFEEYERRYTAKALVYKGYEILDENEYVYDPNYAANAQEKFFHYTRPIIHTPGGNPIPERGLIKWMDGVRTLDVDREIRTAVQFPGNYPNVSFSGTIEGDDSPARYEVGVTYRIPYGLYLNKPAAGEYLLEYTNENELGFLTKQSVVLEPGNPNVYVDDDWIGTPFNIEGGGYHEVTLLYRRNSTATPVIVAGKELRVVDLRFVAVPGSKGADFAANPSIFTANGAIDLKEGRGDGKVWYLRERTFPSATDINTYGNRDYNFNRIYSFAVGDRVVFNAMDADPHGFLHYDTEWYISQRLMSKWLTDQDLVSKITWYIDGELEGNGRHFAYTFAAAGKFTLEAKFNETSLVKHKIIVRPEAYVNNSSSTKGTAQFYDISEEQKTWLRDFLQLPSLDLSQAKVVKVEDIFSRYTYVDGQRAPINNTSNKPNRYGPEGDFNAKFRWALPHLPGVLYYDGTMIESANNRPPVQLTYDDQVRADADWIPDDWIRHHVGENPNDINPAILSEPEQAAKTYWTPQYEPWQWRLPWVATTAWHGYRTRWNIKALYNMQALFDNNQGAFSGTKYGLTDLDTYRQNVYGNDTPNGNDASQVLPGYDESHRKMYDFFWDLVSGRKLVVNAGNLTNGASFTVYAETQDGARGDRIATGTYSGASTAQSYDLQNMDKAELGSRESFGSSLRVYPNPTHSVTNLFFGLAEAGTVDVRITNLAGQQVYRQSLGWLDEGSHSIELNDLYLTPSAYLLEVTSPAKRWVEKLVIQN